jgi:hypothetical protein
MPRLQQPPQRSAESVRRIDELLGLAMLGKLSQVPQITPAPHGSDSLELARKLDRVLRSLKELETMRPYLEAIHDPYLSSSGQATTSDDPSLDYQSLPPTRVVTMKTRFIMRGRGKPKSYPLEDD